MVCNSKKGFSPVAIYGRRARKPLADHLQENEDSWGNVGNQPVLYR